MSHLGREAMRRFVGGENGPQEAEAAAEHILSCERCLALAGTAMDELRARRPDLKREGLLQLVFDAIDKERQWGVESLAALAEWAEIRRLASKKSQRERVRMAKACHTIAFFTLVLDTLKEESSWAEAEFLASLALLSAEAMIQRQQITVAKGHDLQAKVWTAIANSRRRAAEWNRARQGLDNAERHLKEGTGDPLLRARLLSIKASTLADQGHVSRALSDLKECKALYEDLAEWTLLARTLVQEANVLAGIDPAKGLLALDQAAPLLPADDSYLRLLAELLRVECLIEAQRPIEALPVFRRCLRLLISYPSDRMRIRSKFTGARLLGALGFNLHAEKLFDEVIDRDIEHELYKDAFLDLLYLYEHHMKAGDLEQAARVCRRALTDSTLAEVAHDQLRDLWSDLLEAAQHRALSQDRFRELRQYVNVHWKHPAGTPPVVRG